MSEFAAFMLTAPTSNSMPVYSVPKKPKTTRTRSNSATRVSRRSFRHSRTSSGSQTSTHRSSNDTAYTNDPESPATVGFSAYGHQPQQHPTSPEGRLTTAGRTISQPDTRAITTSRPPLARPPIERLIYRSRTAHGIPPVDYKDVVAMHPEIDSSKIGYPSKQSSLAYSRAESLSSASGTLSLSTRTLTSTDPSASDADSALASKPFVLRNGRTYLNDLSLAYPLPSDLQELHRQSLRTLLLIQVFGGPVCSSSLLAKPPLRVLEVGCGSGFWSMMCHRFFKGRGHSNISFTGIDIAPLAPGSANIAADAVRPDKDMKWKFIHHDLRQTPWPLPSDEFDLVMVKDMSIAVTNHAQQQFTDEWLRVLRPGGTVEIWESDNTIRMLRPHVPSAVMSGDNSDEHEAASSLGAYVMTANTPLSAPLNTFLVEYNNWLTKALDGRELTACPCTLIGPSLLQESEALADVRSRRLAIPLSEVRWEREGVGGVVTKDGKSYVESKGKMPHQKVEKKTLSIGQAALRNTALLTIVQQIQALEPLLRDASGKSQDEWDVWLGKMMNDLLTEGGTSWGECLEVGAWCAKKKK